MLHAAGPHQFPLGRMPVPPAKPDNGALRAPLPLSTISDAISRLRYGAITLTVHDGKLVQMDVTERQRFS
ncbi:uncharacterized protein DUF2292 [Blastomonas natatoria]|uniref:Uncharacterized protein DUF2292 n=2 Tax=Blastomonas natatoria TaxID=34015 RepID=A0A2V3V705_9SPHN|nr:uncharacterized protein DUF2292 [Blastomonas natatoria]